MNATVLSTSSAAPISPVQTSVFLNLHDQSIVLPEPDSALRLVTKLAFAIVTILGGMVVGTGEMTGVLPWILVFFSVIGFVFVDWLKLFALPSVIAYAAMVFAAIYSVSDFVQTDIGTGRKMIAVAELLIIAQSILMLQNKSQRLFEQLFVFAVLNCVVAAVFNDAFSYATWLIPLAIVSGIALTLLAADATAEQTAGDSVVTTSAAVASVHAAGFRTSLITLLAIFPAVLLFATCFFFGLPRTGRATRGGSAGATMVGYSDSLRLEQIGQMLQSNETALRVRLTEAESGRPYRLIGGIYLRGKVLERYLFQDADGESAASWRAIVFSDSSAVRPLPNPFIPPRSSDKNFYDHVQVSVECEPSRSPTLFSIAPFHRTSGSEPAVQILGRWELRRSDLSSGNLFQRYPKMTYAFGTHGFNKGTQSEWTAYQSTSEDPAELNSESYTIMSSPSDLDYLDVLTQNPTSWIPSAGLIADGLVDQLRPDQRTSFSIAKKLEQHLAVSGKFEYTLNLNTKPRPGVDPIEQFLTTDRRGHCQYFASALAMMLRSQGIPVRMVVGYRTEEFNELGQYFIVRQSHAHAWVEALIPQDAVPMGRSVHGQTPSSHYWLRLDPTPGGGGIDGADGSQMLDMAKNLWDNYVVELDPDRQKRSLMTTPGLAPMTQSYRSWIDRLQDFATRINAGEVEGFRSRPTFSFSAAIASILLCIVAVVAVRLQLPQWLHRRFANHGEALAPRPSLPFYAEALDLMAQYGRRRRAGQTPREFLSTLDETKPESTIGSTRQLIGPLGELTSAFYDLRYRRRETDGDVATGPWIKRIDDALDQLRKHSR